MDWSALITAIFGATPPAWTWYDIARDFVLPGMIGVVGFGGIILTLRANARLSLEQHVREITLRKKVMSNGLLVEFLYVKDNLEDSLKFIDEMAPDDKFFILRLPLSFKSIDSAADLGLLEDTKISSVFTGWMAIERYRARVLSICKEGAETTDHLVSVPSSFAQTHRELIASTIALIELCIPSIDERSSQPEQGTKHSANA